MSTTVELRLSSCKNACRLSRREYEPAKRMRTSREVAAAAVAALMAAASRRNIAGGGKLADAERRWLWRLHSEEGCREVLRRRLREGGGGGEGGGD